MRAAFALSVFALAFHLAACNSKPADSATAPATATPAAPGPDLTALNPQNIVAELTKYGRQYPGSELVLHTTLGDIHLKLYDDTPLHRANFLLLARKKFFDEGGFYRIVKDFVIQGGDDDDRQMSLGAYKIPAERRPNHFHQRGALAMARFGDADNPTKASSNHDFYIVQGKTYSDAELDEFERINAMHFTPAQRQVYKTIGGAPALDAGYTVFGEVTSGLDVVKKIADTPVDAQKWPKTEVLMKVEVAK
jgi:cyclophilin family peptidyl-prolyl cis-trans isomerase